MTKKMIDSYKDLQDERERLKVQVQNQLSAIEDNFETLKDSFHPVQMALNAAGKVVSMGASTAVSNAMANTLFSKVMKINAVAKSPVAKKLNLPFLLKGFAFHLLSKYSMQILSTGVDLVTGGIDKVKEKKAEKKLKKLTEELEEAE